MASIPQEYNMLKKDLTDFTKKYKSKNVLPNRTYESRSKILFNQGEGTAREEFKLIPQALEIYSFLIN